jgi:hypothetical protein
MGLFTKKGKIIKAIEGMVWGHLVGVGTASNWVPYHGNAFVLDAGKKDLGPE